MKTTWEKGINLWVFMVVAAISVAAAAPSPTTGEERKQRELEGLMGLEGLEDMEGLEGLEELEGLGDEELTELSRRMGRSDREGKFFLLMMQIRRSVCTTTDGTQLGVCLPFNDCPLNNGVASGTCANGLGVCCLLQRSCGGTTRQNNTYFVSPGYYSTTTTTTFNTNDTTEANGESSSPASPAAAAAAASRGGVCTLTVNRMNNNICQMRLDFQDFELEQPNRAGKCITDYLSVTPSTAPHICGRNSGQHMYINVRSSRGPVVLTVDQSTTSRMERRWNVKVTQIACNSQYRAPTGCLQYYRGTSGNVRSFNYDDSPTTRDSGASGTRQLANSDYGVCVEMGDDNCGIEWTLNTRNASDHGFSVSGNADGTLRSLIGTRFASSRGDQCTTDYVLIPGGMTDKGEHVDRLCGLGFPDAVMSTSKPFGLTVKTDASEEEGGTRSDLGNRGFNLNYRQVTEC